MSSTGIACKVFLHKFRASKLCKSTNIEKSRFCACKIGIFWVLYSCNIMAVLYAVKQKISQTED